MSDSFIVSEGQHVAFLSGNPNYPVNTTFAEELKKIIKNGSLLIGTQQELNLSGVPSSSLDVVISKASSPSDHSLTLLLELYRVLRGDGLFVCYEPLENRTFEISENLKRNLTIAGFISTKITASGTFIEIIAKKPEWETGTVQPIKIRKKNPVEKPSVAWTTNIESDLMDESELLDAADKIKPDMTAIRAEFDCGSGASGGKACKNCTCGRAELEAQGEVVTKKKVTLEMLENPGVESSCGSCGLGDAFRCKGCPYRGLPAFAPGQKIVLPDDFFVDQF